MEIKELRKKSKEELRKMLAELREKYRSMRFKVSTRELKTVREVRINKRLIARILTILSERRDEKEAPAVAVAKKE
ncbi:MAG: 50S ribosomal protein L29 [Patescibacteria group bacterium]|nr:50S ribosomal protein L29 [Patescibacteria group bacterium]